MNKEIKLPAWVDLELTYDCNQKCNYCYNFDRKKCSKPKYEEDQALDIDSFKKLLNKIKKFSPLRLNFIGGEPLLRKDLVIEGLIFAKSNNIMSTMNSNFLLATEKDIDRFIELNLASVLVPLSSFKPEVHDAITNLPGSHKQLIKNVKLAKKKGLKIGIIMVVTKQNINQIYETGLFVKNKLGINTFLATMIHGANQSHKNLLLNYKDITFMLDCLLKLKDKDKMYIEAVQSFTPCMFTNPEKYSFFLKKSCNVCRDEFVIRWNGDVKPCIEMGYKGINILTDSVEEVIKKREALLSPEHKFSCAIPQECMGCAEVNFCRGGCRVMAKEFNGGSNKKNPYMTKPLKEPVKRKQIHIDFIKNGFKEDLKKIIIREEEKEVVCCLEGKIFRISKQEFSLLKLLIMDNKLLNEDTKGFAKKYGIENSLLNKFLQKISRNQELLND